MTLSATFVIWDRTRDAACSFTPPTRFCCLIDLLCPRCLRLNMSDQRPWSAAPSTTNERQAGWRTNKFFRPWATQRDAAVRRISIDSHRSFLSAASNVMTLLWCADRQSRCDRQQANEFRPAYMTPFSGEYLRVSNMTACTVVGYNLL